MSKKYSRLNLRFCLSGTETTYFDIDRFTFHLKLYNRYQILGKLIYTLKLLFPSLLTFMCIYQI